MFKKLKKRPWGTIIGRFQWERQYHHTWLNYRVDRFLYNKKFTRLKFVWDNLLLFVRILIKKNV